MDDERRWQMVAWVAAAAVVVFLGARWLGGHGEDAGTVPPARVEGGPATQAGAPRGSAQAGVYVHVAGAVRRPGLYRVRTGTRVAGAIQRAGGGRPRANLSAVNLAARVEDGQQVVVPGPGTPAPGGAGAPGAAQAGGAGGAKVSLGQASLEQLDGLDGIGPTLAKRIVEYRTHHGGFHSLEQLQEVDGIGPKRFAALRKALAP
jgi:competence protein ComEA